MPETELATTWLAPVATATAAGMPISIKSGVMRNPPPMPNMPERKPTAVPMPNMVKRFTEVSAIGDKPASRTME